MAATNNFIMCLLMTKDIDKYGKKNTFFYIDLYGVFNQSGQVED